MRAPAHARRTLVQNAFRTNSDNLSLRVVHGASFAVAGIAVRVGITLVSMAVLARLLTPADFGHVVMANVVTELAVVFSSFGLGQIIIQRKRLARLQIDTIWWATLALGILLTTVVAGISFLVSVFFFIPLAGELLRVLCLTFVLDQLTVVPNSLLSRTLMFRQLFGVQVATLLFRAGSAIVLAIWGAGVWSLVWAAVAASAVQLVICTFLAGFRPRMRFSSAFLKSTLRTTGSYFASGIMFYANTNLDLAIVGRSLGATALGFYQAARGLADDISARIAVPLQRVLMPAFATVQDDLARFRFGVMRSGRLLALVTIPVGFGVASVADELIPILYGVQWLPMIPLLKILAPAAGLRAATTISQSVFQAANRVDISMRLNLVWITIMLALLVLVRSYGLYGFATIYALNAAFALIVLGVSLRLANIARREMGGMLMPPIAAALVMMGAVYSMRALLEGMILSEFMRFFVLVASGVVTYCCGILLMARQHCRDIRDVISLFRKK